MAGYFKRLTSLLLLLFSYNSFSMDRPASSGVPSGTAWIADRKAGARWQVRLEYSNDSHSNKGIRPTEDVSKCKDYLESNCPIPVNKIKLPKKQQKIFDRRFKRFHTNITESQLAEFILENPNERACLQSLLRSDDPNSNPFRREPFESIDGEIYNDPFDHYLLDHKRTTPTELKTTKPTPDEVQSAQEAAKSLSEPTEEAIKKITESTEFIPTDDIPMKPLIDSDAVSSIESTYDPYANITQSELDRAVDDLVAELPCEPQYDLDRSMQKGSFFTPTPPTPEDSPQESSSVAPLTPPAVDTSPPIPSTPPANPDSGSGDGVVKNAVKIIFWPIKAYLALPTPEKIIIGVGITTTAIIIHGFHSRISAENSAKELFKEFNALPEEYRKRFLSELKSKEIKFPRHLKESTPEIQKFIETAPEILDRLAKEHKDYLKNQEELRKKQLEEVRQKELKEKEEKQLEEASERATQQYRNKQLAPHLNRGGVSHLNQLYQAYKAHLTDPRFIAHYQFQLAQAQRMQAFTRMTMPYSPSMGQVLNTLQITPTLKKVGAAISAAGRRTLSGIQGMVGNLGFYFTRSPEGASSTGSSPSDELGLDLTDRGHTIAEALDLGVEQISDESRQRIIDELSKDKICAETIKKAKEVLDELEPFDFHDSEEMINKKFDDRLQIVRGMYDFIKERLGHDIPELRGSLYQLVDHQLQLPYRQIGGTLSDVISNPWELKKIFRGIKQLMDASHLPLDEQLAAYQKIGGKISRGISWLRSLNRYQSKQLEERIGHYITAPLIAYDLRNILVEGSQLASRAMRGSGPMPPAAMRELNALSTRSEAFAERMEGVGLQDVIKPTKEVPKKPGCKELIEGEVKSIQSRIQLRKTKIKDHPVLNFERTGSALKKDIYHAFPDIIDNFAEYAQKFEIESENFGMVDLYQIEGSVNGQDGVFEWIHNRKINKITHRLFVRGAKVTGKVNQWKSKK